MSRNSSIIGLSLQKNTLNSPILNLVASRAVSKFSFSKNFVSKSVSPFLRIDKSKQFMMQNSQFHKFIDRAIVIDNAVQCSVTEQDKSFSALLTYDTSPRCLVNIVFSDSQSGAIVSTVQLSCTSCTFNNVSYGSDQGVIKTTMQLEMYDSLFQSCLCKTGATVGSVIDFNSSEILTLSGVTFSSCSGILSIVNVVGGAFNITNTIFNGCSATQLIYAEKSTSINIANSEFNITDQQIAFYSEDVGQITFQNIVIQGGSTQNSLFNIYGVFANPHLLENITIRLISPPPYFITIDSNFSLKNLLIETTFKAGNYYVFNGTGNSTNAFPNVGCIYVNTTSASNLHVSVSTDSGLQISPSSVLDQLGGLPIVNATGGAGGTGTSEPSTATNTDSNTSSSSPAQNQGTTPLTPLAITMIVILCIVVAFGVFGAIFSYVRLCRHDMPNEVFDPTIGPAFP